MRSYCLMCQTPSDYIDLTTGQCENCCVDAEHSRLVSRQSALGATKAAAVRISRLAQRRDSEGEIKVNLKLD